jgi:hypothetical protein
MMPAQTMNTAMPSDSDGVPAFMIASTKGWGGWLFSKGSKPVAVTLCAAKRWSTCHAKSGQGRVN